MGNNLSRLMAKYQKGKRPVFHLGPFLPLIPLQEKGLIFNRVFQHAPTMAAAARLSFEFDFESTVIPFDLNLEAEVLGARVFYHDGFEGHPVYPTIAHRPVKTAGDIRIPSEISQAGRLPVVLSALDKLQDSRKEEGALGIFMPGPLTLAGQVMEPEMLFSLLLKDPGAAQDIFARLSDFLSRLRDVYQAAGVDFVVIEEGGGAAISPGMFGKLVLPYLRTLFAGKPCPMIISLTGGSDKFLDHLLACQADGVNIDRQCDLAGAREKTPPHLPLFTGCGPLDMLAVATPETVTAQVKEALARGVTTVTPPADIYPPAKAENIHAFVRAVREYDPAIL